MKESQRLLYILMKSFGEWLACHEKAARTGLGIYPPLYHVGQYPPLAQTPVSATAALALTTIHKKTMDQIMGKSKGHKKKHHKKKHHKKHRKGD